jgi:hypothetical protein
MRLVLLLLLLLLPWRALLMLLGAMLNSSTSLHRCQKHKQPQPRAQRVCAIQTHSLVMNHGLDRLSVVTCCVLQLR